MEHDQTDDEIQKLLRQPMGREAERVVWGWLQRYKRDALAAAAAGQTREEREANVQEVHQALLELLQGELLGLIHRENECEAAIREATERAKGVYDERFDREVGQTLEDPAFTRSVAERIANAELYTFRRELAAEVADLVRYH